MGKKSAKTISLFTFEKDETTFNIAIRKLPYGVNVHARGVREGTSGKCKLLDLGMGVIGECQLRHVKRILNTLLRVWESEHSAEERQRISTVIVHYVADDETAVYKTFSRDADPYKTFEEPDE